MQQIVAGIHRELEDEPRGSTHPGRNEDNQPPAGPASNIHPPRGREQGAISRKEDNSLAIRLKVASLNFGDHTIERRLIERLGITQGSKIGDVKGDATYYRDDDKERHQSED